MTKSNNDDKANSVTGNADGGNADGVTGNSDDKDARIKELEARLKVLERRVDPPPRAAEPARLEGHSQSTLRLLDQLSVPQHILDAMQLAVPDDVVREIAKDARRK